MAGTLTIYAAEAVPTPGDSFAGHCWIEYEPVSGPILTYGTWGNNPDGLGTGLLEKLEPGRAGVAQRSVYLDDLEEARLMKWIQQYNDKVQEGWRPRKPSSGFASDAWYTATGERLKYRGRGMSSSASLIESIEQANAKGDAIAAPVKATDTGLTEAFLRKQGRSLSRW